MMKPILIVGHPRCGHERIENLLIACGMRPPVPSRRDGFLPVEIGDILRKILQQKGDDEAIQQLLAGPIWQGMVQIIYKIAICARDISKTPDPPTSRIFPSVIYKKSTQAVA